MHPKQSKFFIHSKIRKQMKLLKLLNQWIGRLFTKHKENIQDVFERAVMITEVVKHIVSTPLLDAAAALTPFTHDEKALAALRKSLPYVTDLLGITEKAIEQDAAEILKHVSEVLEKRGSQFKKLFYRELAAALAAAMSDGKVSAWEVFTLTQLIYKQLKEDNAATVVHNGTNDENKALV